MSSRIVLGSSLALVALSMGGCVSPDRTAATSGPSLAAVEPASLAPVPKPPAGKWNMPWQLNPASAASEEQGEKTYTALVDKYGYVKGTTPALTYINYPLTTLAVKRGRNRTVDACKSVVASEAKPLGAVKVEATSAGPERRTADGYEGPVAFRILYAKPQGYEVRQSLLTCKVDRAGGIKDAFVDTNSTSRLAKAPAAGAPPASYVALTP